MPKDVFQHEIDVLKFQRDKLILLDKSYSDINSDLNELEKRVQEFTKSKNTNSSKISTIIIKETDTNVLDAEIKEKQESKSFNDLVVEANKNGYIDANIKEVASTQEIKEANDLLHAYYKDFTKQYDLDKYDYAISGIIGTIAALIDYFLVTNVDGKNVTSGKLKSGVEDLWNSILSQEKIKSLEELNKVTYDISSNTSKISKEVLGLCPLYHRFQSLGHDPILGFVLGVADLMRGTLTAIDGNGRLIIQSVSGSTTKSFIESIITVFGHFLSDVGTKSKTGKILSVPAPLTPLLQLIQNGSIEYKGEKFTVADLSKKMYYDGYNFNHFMGMSVPVFLIEVLMRLSFVIKEIFYSKKDISIKKNPKLDVMLCIANGILFAENVGKLAITKNPFSINYIAWISTAKYGFKTLKWIVYDRELGKIGYAQQYIDASWEYLELSSREKESSLFVYCIE